MVTREEIENIALLAKLYLPEEEIEGLTEEMNRIIAFADTISAAGESDEAFDQLNPLENVLREDEVVPSYPPEEILQNAGGGEDGFFFLPHKQSGEGR